MRQIALDTETTGINTSDGHRIIEIGCIEMENRRITGKEFHCYINPEREIDEGATRVHGLTYEKLKNEPLFKDIKSDFMNFISGSELIIHNADFDVGFINNELSLLGRSELSNPIIDTVSLARKVLNTRVANLDYLCRRFKVDLSERDLHGALLDSRLLAEVYLELRGGKQFSMNLAKKNQENN